MGFEQGPYFARVREVEHGGDSGAFAARAYELAVGPPTEGEAKRLDQDRFARTGFTRKHGQAVLEFDVDRTDDNEILNRQRS